MLPTFPSRYWFTIGLRQSLALRDGPRRFGQDSTCPALLRCRPCDAIVTHTGVSPSLLQLSRCFRFLCASLWPVLQPRLVRKPAGLGSSRFARHYSGNRFFFLLLRVLRCFSSPGSPHLRWSQVFNLRGCPIRTHTDQGLFAAPRTFSQLTASFVACRSQGILHTPLLLFLCESSLSCEIVIVYL